MLYSFSCLSLLYLDVYLHPGTIQNKMNIMHERLKIRTSRRQRQSIRMRAEKRPVRILYYFFGKRNQWGCPLLYANKHIVLYIRCLEKGFHDLRACFLTSKLGAKTLRFQSGRRLKKNVYYLENGCRYLYENWNF